jgi:hypothetical protein
VFTAVLVLGVPPPTHPATSAFSALRSPHTPFTHNKPSFSKNNVCHYLESAIDVVLVTWRVPSMPRSAPICTPSAPSSSITLPDLSGCVEDGALSQGQADYHELTHEVVRFNLEALACCPMFVDVAWQWVCCFLYLSAQDPLSLRVRDHWCKRLQLYKDRRTKRGTDPELLPREHHRLVHLREWLYLERPRFDVVEISWNALGRICKIGIVIEMECTGRFLFLCIGCDKGLKTGYVTSAFKARSNYAITGSDCVCGRVA